MPNRVSRRAATSNVADAPSEAVAVPTIDTQELDIPAFNAGAVHIVSSGNDVMFVFSALRPSLGTNAVAAPVAAVTLSRGAATELVAVTQGILAALDKDLGAIDTPFMKARREGKSVKGQPIGGVARRDLTDPK